MLGRIIAVSALVAFFSAPAFAGDTYVHGYTRRDGTYVEGYHRTTPDSNPYNNYSTKGNVNPWTGQPGNKDPYPSTYHYTGPKYPVPQSSSNDDNSGQ